VSDFHNEKLRALAKRSNADQMSPENAFVQGFILGRKYERQFNTQLHNSILREMRNNSGHNFDDNNYWDNRITELEKENFDLKYKDKENYDG
jgi:hypothetical protein